MLFYIHEFLINFNIIIKIKTYVWYGHVVRPLPVFLFFAIIFLNDLSRDLYLFSIWVVVILYPFDCIIVRIFSHNIFLVLILWFVQRSIFSLYILKNNLVLASLQTKVSSSVCSSTILFSHCVTGEDIVFSSFLDVVSIVSLNCVTTEESIVSCNFINIELLST